MSECLYVCICTLTLKSAFQTNILLNLKCIDWCLSFSESNSFTIPQPHSSFSCLNTFSASHLFLARFLNVPLFYNSAAPRTTLTDLSLFSSVLPSKYRDIQKRLKPVPEPLLPVSRAQSSSHVVLHRKTCIGSFKLRYKPKLHKLYG